MASNTTSTEQAFINLSILINSMNLGNMHDEVMNVLLNQNNEKLIQQAINDFGYFISDKTDDNAVIKMKRLYWAVYYLKTFPISSFSQADCGQIYQTLVQLTNEKANLAQAKLSAYNTGYTKQDIEIREQVIVDFTTRFNGMYAQLNCTAAQSKESSNIVFYSVIIAGVLIGIIVIKKLFVTKNPAKK